MSKKILLISYNFSPEPTGIGKYNGEMISWLAKQGHDCSIVTTYPYYPHWKVQEPYYKMRFWFSKAKKTLEHWGKIRTYRCPQYVPSKPSGMKRILQEVSFFVTASFQLTGLLYRKKYDLVITVAPSFLLGLLGVVCKNVSGAKFVYHIQDLQIEAARDLQMIKSPKVIDSLFRIEKYIFDKADYVSSISEGMVAKIEAKAKKEILFFPNWADVSLFYPLENRKALKKDFSFNETDKVILYSGAIGEKQGLEAILNAAKEFKNLPQWKFLICGSGPYKEKLQEMANSQGLYNVVFFPLQPFEKFNQFLNMADVHLVIQKANASDLVMPSKLTTILAVGGLALITANEGVSLHTLCKKHDMAIVVNAEDQEALNEGLRHALTSDTTSITQNARIYAEQYLSIENVMKSFEQEVLN
ncbi:MAG: WcaI family glycosyltransferase [Pyrinomonadaceae bacterium]|nr:WcaI family glycosyltransferase [Sphingobacteriaceae bacterium]